MQEFYHEPSAKFARDFIQNLPTTDTGKPFVLYDWQNDVINEFYGTMASDEDTGDIFRKYQYLYLELPKKNGKSELSGALGLLHLVADGEKTQRCMSAQRTRTTPVSSLTHPSLWQRIRLCCLP